MALNFGTLGAAMPPRFAAPSQIVSQGAFNVNPFQWPPPGQNPPGGGGGGHPPGGNGTGGLKSIGQRFLNAQDFNQNNLPSWMHAFRQAFFQGDPGPDRHRAVTQFLNQHDPFVTRYTHLINQLRRFGILIPDSGGGGAIGAGGSYYMRPLYGQQLIQSPLSPPPPPPPVVY